MTWMFDQDELKDVFLVEWKAKIRGGKVRIGKNTVLSSTEAEIAPVVPVMVRKMFKSAYDVKTVKIHLWKKRNQCTLDELERVDFDVDDLWFDLKLDKLDELPDEAYEDEWEPIG